MIFRDRDHAGKLLASQLLKHRDENTLVLALPRGGVPVGAQIAELLGIPLDILAVRKIGAPFNPELALGAICEDVSPVLSDSVLDQIGMKAEDLASIVETEKKEIHRQIQKFRNGKSLTDLSGKTVIVVDDGLATGSTVMAAIKYLRTKGVGKIVVAVPIAATSSAHRVRTKADEFVAVEESEDLLAVGYWYENFEPVSDHEVISLLKKSRLIKEASKFSSQVVNIAENGVKLEGELTFFPNMKSLIIFAHGSGSSRKSPRNIQVARFLNQNGFGTLLFDLLTQDESENRKNVFDIELLGERLACATRWVRKQPHFKDTYIGYFGASTGAAATLQAASRLAPKDRVYAIVSRGGRPDLAGDIFDSLDVPTLLLVGEWDDTVVELNRDVQKKLKKSKLVIIPGATHLFEESGTLEEVSQEAARWFTDNLPGQPIKRNQSKATTLDEAISKNMRAMKTKHDVDEIARSLKDKRVVMLGEATHGTVDFYDVRSLISQSLIRDYGFKFIAVEGDWPDCYRLNRYIQSGNGGSARSALLKNHRWPTWMWANEEIVELAEWMKGRGAGFYGLDVYSLFESMNETMAYLEKNNSKLAQEVKRRYSCFEPFQRDEIAYAKSLMQFPPGCEQEVLQNLQKMLDLRVKEVLVDGDELFSAQQNAQVVANAESYYRAMLEGDASSWNVRDGHMMETLDQLLERYGENAKGIVWAHNTHIGDYRATDMKKQGYVNLGGLARQSYGAENVALVGFGTYEGEVLAGSAWGAEEEVMTLPPAKEGSYESYFHRAAIKAKTDQFYLLLNEMTEPNPFSETRGHRAVGVVYNPAHENRGNYVPTELSRRYDAFVFLDRTHALKSLHAIYAHGQIPEMWPTGQ